MSSTARTTRLLALAGGFALAVGLAAPATAEVTSVPDGADVPSLNDIRRVRVDHGADDATVRVRFADLRKESEAGPASIGIFLDTRPGRRGPEFRLGSGLQDGSDYQLVRMRAWRPVGEPKTCDHDVRLRFARDVLVFRVARSCIGGPEQLRVGAKMTDQFDASHPVVDWMTGRREWTPWVASD
jgi:hypothetical protein